MRNAFSKQIATAGHKLVNWAASALLLLPITVLGSLAQTPPELRALRSRQVAAIEKIEQTASARGAPGTPERTAVLRAGLPTLGEIAEGRFDFDGSGPATSTEATQPIDSDPVFQKRVARRYETARRALIDTPEDASAVEGRIVGGRRVKDPDFASTVAIVQTSRPECTGSYVGGGRVLTAAHCVCELRLHMRGLGWRIAFGDVVPGGLLNGRQERPLMIDPSKTSVFPAVNGAQSDFCARYQRAGSVPEAGLDLAVLIVAELVPETFPKTGLGSESMLSQALAEDGELANPFQAAGFGKSWDNDRLIVTGRKHAAFILSGEICPSSGRFGVDELSCMATKEVSAFDASGRDTCNGDSGGPLFVAGDGPRDWYLVGVTSRALRKSDRFCGGGGIYALITSTEVVDWLRANGVPLP